MNGQSIEGNEHGVPRGMRVPPFLQKLFRIVNDPETNPVISWGSYGTSIIISDQITLSTDVLPKYFKHSNFSSFVYQLNNYGFRKIGLNDCEYESPYFQAGREYLLENMTRRERKPRIATQQIYQGTTFCSKIFNNSPLGSKVEALRREIKESGREIEELCREQARIEAQIVEFQNIKTKYEKIIDILGSECEQIVESEASKKRKLSSTETCVENENMNEVDMEFENLERNVTGDQEKVAGYMFWQQIMEEDSCQVCDDGEPIGDQVTKEQAEITTELEVSNAILPDYSEEKR